LWEFTFLLSLKKWLCSNGKKEQPNPRLKLTAKAPRIADFLTFVFLGYN
jgi:hypothetical protein